MKALVLASVVLAGCSFRITAATDDGGGSDVDSPACEAWRPQHVDPCTLIAPTGLDLVATGTYVYDTDTRTLLDPGGTPIEHASEDRAALVVISADHLLVGPTSTLRAIGMKPLLVAAWTTAVIEGRIDVSSTVGDPGAGASTAACSTPAPGESDIGGAAGGGGGGFGAEGGKGGDGDSNQDAGNDGISVGAAPGSAVAPPAVVRAGCPGGNGGVGTNAMRGQGGAGGGAFELVAKDSITVLGGLHAGGQGGTGTSNDGGGGGGGSGGYLGLDAPTVMLDGGTVVANGGAGAGGGDDGNVGGLGENGRASAIVAAGGIGGLPGGTRGGDGGVAGAAAGRGVTITNTGGGGGGGGGVGMILVWSQNVTTTNATISPSITNP